MSVIVHLRMPWQHDPVKGPPPLATFSSYDRTMKNAWGHSQCCERPYARQETTTYIKVGVTAKPGSSWLTTTQFEKGKSVSASAMYGGSLREPTFEQLVELKRKKG